MVYDGPLPDVSWLVANGEPFAAGFFEEPDAPPMRRWSRAVQRRFERRAAPAYGGEQLYPSGPAGHPDEDPIVKPSFSFTWQWNGQEMARRMETAGGDDAEQLRRLKSAMDDWYARVAQIEGNYGLGGRGYTHSIPNYGRVVREGLDEHGRRVESGLARAREQGDEERVDFFLGLQDVLAGIRAWHVRLLEALRKTPCEGAEARARRDRLVTAFERVPFLPARDFFEALLAYHFVFYLDDCDNPGRVDQELIEFYERDASAGRVTREEAVALIREFWENCDANNSWCAAIGGTSPNGGHGYNALTSICLEAARNMRRPNLQLGVRRDMPDDVWEAALDTLGTGCGLPALYNDEAFSQALRDLRLRVREADLAWRNGGGCTETMIHGRSNVGSLDAGVNLLGVLGESLEHRLPSAGTFEDLVEGFKRDMARTVRETIDRVNAHQETKARWNPQPMRSLLIDDCIDEGVEFHNGGARYNWSVINIGGLANVFDSLAAIREVVFEKRELGGAELVAVLRADFEGHEHLRRRLERCPRFGNDDRRVDGLASELSEFLFREFLLYAPWRGGRFLPSCIMFTTYGRAGAEVGATPDGRKAGEPVADSAGAAQGRDRSGPTALVKSVVSLPHRLGAGTLVVNLRFSKDTLTKAESRGKLRQLVRTYFDLGGMQIQINVVDQAVLRDALAHPERHASLVVRVGGFSEYFNRLSDDLKRTVLERVEHGV